MLSVVRLLALALIVFIGLLYKAGLCHAQDRSGNGITVYKPGKFYNGYTLFCHSYEDPKTDSEDGLGHIYLIDMEGNVVYEWTTKTAQQSFLRLLPNGNLYYPTRDRSNINQAGLRELDPNSNVVWYYHCRIDHDYYILENGNLMIHCITDRMSPHIGPELKRMPYILEITRDKKLVWEWRGEEHLDELKELLKDHWPKIEERIRGRYSFDWAHNNTCQVIADNPTGKKDPRFRKGNLIFSYRSLDIIGVIDRDTGEIVWAWGPGELDGQHKPHMLPNGNILIYDNGTLRKWSRVIELDPLREEIAWEYTGTPKESFFSAAISGAQLLPNGNILICEGGPCRIFEVTPDKEIVWEFRSPLKKKGALAIYRANRYSPEYVRPLLER